MESIISEQCFNQYAASTNSVVSLSLLLQTIFANCVQSPIQEKWPKDYGPIALQNGLETYDFIIVGAGSAGSVVANRLSEVQNWKILLLEAGGDPPIESNMPGLSSKLLNTNIDWQYRAELSNQSGKISPLGNYWARGKVLGGTSTINSMVYLRGNDRDYNDWEKMGNPTWEWNNVLEYFKKSEDMHVNEITQAFNSKYHGIGGPLKVDVYNPDSPIRDMFFNASQELGYKILPNIDEEFIGIHTRLATIDNNNIRSSAARAFLLPIRNRTNLHIIKNAHVTQITFDQLGKANGVEFLLKGTILTAKQSKEIIISAGAVNTPQLLMLSGIGKRKHLKKFNIECISNLAVGKNLQDHPITNLFFRINNPAPNMVTAGNTNSTLIDDLKQYLTKRSGPLTRISTYSIAAFFNTVNLTDTYPDIQVAPYLFKKGQHENLQNFFTSIGYDAKLLNNIVLANKDSDLILFYIVIMKPYSTGQIMLQSANPLEYPVIQSNFFNKPEDLQTLVRGIKLVRKFLNTTSFIEQKVEELSVNLPECNNLLDSEKYLECYIRHVSTTAAHAAGTAKMGPDSDKNSVVDSRLRLRGVTGVRVIDASIMPNVVSGNTNAPTIMIGEKGSDFIKEDWGVFDRLSVKSEL